MKIKLLQDIVSVGKNKTCYGEKGEVLKANYGNDTTMLIVNGKKEKFPLSVAKENTHFKFIEK